MEHNSGLIPSFTLVPVGEERSRINLHLFGWFLFGITPNLLVCTCGKSSILSGPITLPSLTSVARNFSTGSGFAWADGMLCFTDEVVWLR